MSPRGGSTDKPGNSMRCVGSEIVVRTGADAVQPVPIAQAEMTRMNPSRPTIPTSNRAGSGDNFRSPDQVGRKPSIYAVPLYRIARLTETGTNRDFPVESSRLPMMVAQSAFDETPEIVALSAVG